MTTAATRVTIGLSVFRSKTNQRRRYQVLKRSYGWFIATSISYLSPSTAVRYERIERSILNGPDGNAIAFQEAVAHEANMTAIAGAIIAQVAITALTLPNLSATHWTVQASLLVAIVSGCLSVFYACSLQRAVGTLYDPSDIKKWLRLSPPKGLTEADVAQTSLAAMSILAAPFIMVRVCILALLLALTMYQGFFWTRGLDTAATEGDSRKVFITFMVSNGVCVLFFVATFSAKVFEDLLQSRRNLSDVTFEEDSESSGDSLDADTAAEEGSVVSRTPVKDQVTIVEKGDVSDSLATALENAARAHLQCAEADRQVALAYAKIPKAG